MLVASDAAATIYNYSLGSKRGRCSCYCCCWRDCCLVWPAAERPLSPHSVPRQLFAGGTHGVRYNIGGGKKGRDWEQVHYSTIQSDVPWGDKNTILSAKSSSSSHQWQLAVLTFNGISLVVGKLLAGSNVRRNRGQACDLQPSVHIRM